MVVQLTIEKKIWDLIAPAVEDLGLKLVRVQVSGSKARSKVQVMIEPAASTPENPLPVTLEHCEKASRAISPLLDVADPIEEAYTLEVSSPGIERPLVADEDFEAYAGHMVAVSLTDPLEGRKRWQGILQGLEGENIVLQAVPEGAMKGKKAKPKGKGGKPGKTGGSVELQEVTLPLERVRNAYLMVDGEILTEV